MSYNIYSIHIAYNIISYNTWLCFFCYGARKDSCQTPAQIYLSRIAIKFIAITKTHCPFPASFLSKEKQPVQEESSSWNLP